MGKYYSQEIPKILNSEQRVVIGNQIISVLKSHLGNLKNLTCLDIGCSSGVITNMLSGYFRKTIGIDVDAQALDRAKHSFRKKNLEFLEMDATRIAFEDKKFDVVIANQVYEFVSNDKTVLNEINRVLKKGGVCFFGARNKYAFIEAQYNIPLLSWVPKKISDFVVRISGKGEKFVGSYRSYWGLLALVKNFKVYDYTLRILRDPERFGFRRLEKYKNLARILPIQFFYPFIPNYIWLLEKR